MRHLLKAIAAAGAALIGLAHAAPVTFVHDGSGSGTIDGQGFSALFSITATADTDDIVDLGGGVFFLDHTSATIIIDGVGTFDFVTGTRTFVNQFGNLVGFSRAGADGADLYNGPNSPMFASYDLSTTIGPIQGFGNLLQWGGEDVLTTGGVLFFDNFGTDAQFTAVVVDAAIPVPAAAFLFAPAAGLLGWMRKRKA